MGLKSYPRVYFELVFIGFTLVMGMGLSSAFLSILATELDPSGILASFVLSVWFLSRIFMELPSGIISDRIGRSRLLIMGLAIGGCGALLCALSNSIYILILGRGIWGLGTALYFMNNTAMILDLFDTSIRGRALGTFQGIEFMGSFIGAPIGAFMADRLENPAIPSYNIVFYVATGLIFCAFLMAFLSRDIRQIGVLKSSGPRVSVREVLLALTNWGVAIVCVNSFFRMLIMQGINSTVFPLYLNREVELSVELIGIVVGARTAGHIMATVVAGYLSDKIGRKPIVIAGMLIEGVSLYVYTVVSSFEFFILAGLIAGFGEGMVFVCLVVLLSEVVASRIRGGAIGLYRTFMDIGGFAGPVLFMIAFDNFGSTSPFYFAAAILMLNVLLLTTVKIHPSSRED